MGIGLLVKNLKLYPVTFIWLCFIKDRKGFQISIGAESGISEYPLRLH